MKNNFFDDCYANKDETKPEESKPAVLLVPYSTTSPKPIASGRAVTRNSNLPARRANHAEQATDNERRRAQLTLSVLNDVGALSVLEAHLCKIAPSGKLRYQTIIDSYALSAAERIARWQ